MEKINKFLFKSVLKLGDIEKERNYVIGVCFQALTDSDFLLDSVFITI